MAFPPVGLKLSNSTHIVVCIVDVDWCPFVRFGLQLCFKRVSQCISTSAVIEHMSLAMVIVRKRQVDLICFYKMPMQDLSPSGCHTYLLHKCCVSDVFFLYPLIKKIVDFAVSRITCPAQRQFASSILSPAPVDRTGPHMHHCRQCVACPTCFFW